MASNEVRYTLVIEDKGIHVIRETEAALGRLKRKAAEPITVRTAGAGAAAPAGQYFLPGMQAPGVGGQYFLPGIQQQTLGGPRGPMIGGAAFTQAGLSSKQLREQLKALGASSEEINKITKGFKSAGDEASAFERTLGRVQRTAIAFLALWTFRKIIQGISEVISLGIEYNKVLETSKLGIQSLIVAQGQFVSESGKVAQGMDAFTQAGKVADETLRQLQVDNLKTIATFQQLVKAYQQTLAPGLGAGLNINQVRQYTVAMVQAAGAMGLNMDMLAEETRSMLRGTITPRQTLIATALGIRNEDIQKYKNDADGLFNFLMGKLDAFGEAGVRSQRTWSGIFSNLKDVISVALGKGFESLFEEVKKFGLDVQDQLMDVDPSGQLRIKPEVIETIKEYSDLLVDILRTARSIGAAIQWWRSYGKGPDVEEFERNLKLRREFLEIQRKAQEYKGPVWDPSQMEEVEKMVYIPTKPAYTQQQLDEINKLIIATGAWRKEDLERVNSFLKGQGMSIDSMEFTYDQMNRLLDLSRQWEKAGTPEAKKLLEQLGVQEYTRLGDEMQIKMKEGALQVAEMNKNYSAQKVLIGEIADAQIKMLRDIHKGDKETIDLIKTIAKERTKAISRVETKELLGEKQEYYDLRAAQAGLLGDIEKQREYEQKSLDIKIQIRKVSQDLRGPYGDLVELAMKEGKLLKDYITDEKRRVTLEQQINQSLAQRAGVAGDYYTQIELSKEALEWTKKQIILSGDFKKTERDRLFAVLDQTEEMKNQAYLLNSQSKDYQTLLDYQLKVANAAGTLEDVYRITHEQLEERVRLLTKLRDMEGINPRIKEEIQAIINAERDWGEVQDDITEKQNLAEYYSKLAELGMRLHELTGNWEAYDKASALAIKGEKLGLETGTAAIRAHADEFGRLIDRYKELNDLARAYDRAIKTAKYGVDISESIGDWDQLIEAQRSVLYLTHMRSIATDGLSAKQKELADLAFELRDAELQAMRDMNQKELYLIGLRKNNIVVTKELADVYENALPQAINAGFDAAHSSLTDFLTGTKNALTSLEDFFENLYKSLVDLSVQIALAAAKMALLKAAGMTGQESTWGTIATTATGMALGAYTGGGVGQMTPSPGMPGSPGMSPTGYQKGGIVTTPQIAMVGEQPEAFIPLERGKVPVELSNGGRNITNHFEFKIYSPDANSFRASEKQILTQAMMQAGRATGRNS